jgi:hypothetical protein
MLVDSDMSSMQVENRGARHAASCRRCDANDGLQVACGLRAVPSGEGNVYGSLPKGAVSSQTANARLSRERSWVTGLRAIAVSPSPTLDRSQPGGDRVRAVPASSLDAVGRAPSLATCLLGFDERHVLGPKVHDVTVRVLQLGQSVVRQRGRLERVESSLDRARRAHRVASEEVQQGRLGHDADPTPSGTDFWSRRCYW